MLVNATIFTPSSGDHIRFYFIVIIITIIIIDFTMQDIIIITIIVTEMEFVHAVTAGGSVKFFPAV